MIKLLLWLDYGEIMEVWEGRNFGILQDSMMYIEFSVGFSRLLLFFSMGRCIMMLSLKCYRSHWKVKKVFLNVQNIRKDNFNLVKSLKNTCKWVYFFAKNERLQRFFQNIRHYISKILSSSNNTYLKGYLSQFLCK